MITKEQERLLDAIIDEIMSDEVESLRQLFLSTPKQELLTRYIARGSGLFIEFKELIRQKFGSSQDDLTIELLSRIYDRIKWLN